MKKFSNFIINKRYFIFAILMLLFVGSILLIPKVTINKDMTKYLPDDSSMKAGISIINEEFPGTLDQKGINVMFKGLKDEDIPNTINTLKGIENVKSVTYDDSENYNKGEYTLFVLDSDFLYKSEEELKIEKDIKNIFKGQDVVVQHVMYATTTIPTGVLIIALTALTIILFIMCSSWIDPILFLLTIGIAVGLNFGTNIILGEVSETTFSLSAILQLVLSMDYSIILMNRYRQEKEKGDVSKKDAMKAAFSSAFPSIMGSGFTTIVGLLMLIFMDFKLGMDLGIVMAKGVALSMICVVTILPTLIILCDKLIFKLSKKSIHPKMNKLARFEFKERFTILLIFLVVFIGSMFMQGYTKTTFAQVKNDKIGEIFTPTNNAIIVYDNNDEENINKLLNEINKDSDVKMSLAYKNTLGLPMNVNTMNGVLTSMAPDLNISDKIAKVIYYDFNNPDKLNEMTLPEFYKVIKDDIMIDPMFSKYFDEETKQKINALGLYMDKDSITKAHNSKELASMLNMSEDKLNIIYPLFYTLMKPYVPNKMDIHEFINFMKFNILSNPIFSNNITEDAKKNFANLETITNVSVITKQMTPVELQAVYQMPIEFVNLVFMNKFGPTVDKTMSMYEFNSYILSDIITKPEYSTLLDQQTIIKLTQMKQIMELGLSNVKLSEVEMSKIIVVDANPAINQIMVKLFYNYRDHLNNKTLFNASLYEIINFTTTIIAPLPMFNGFITEEEKQLLGMANHIMTGVVNDTIYDNNKMYELIHVLQPNINKPMIDLLYLISSSIKCENINDYMLSIEDVMNHIEINILNDERFTGLITEENKKIILDASKMIKDNKKRMVGPDHSLIVLDLNVKEESAETTDFINRLDKMCKDNLIKDYHLVGNSPMNVEMEKGFGKDLLLITILTALAIFIIVAITFKSLIIPLLLVLLVQCGVFMTVCISGIISSSIFYLALLIVQCILMGATIDYAIVFTSYYREQRKTMNIEDSLRIAYQNSLHTIMTSGLIIILVTGLIGLSPSDPAISQICITLSLGTLCAVLLILFVLPSLIAASDRFIIKNKISEKQE